MTMEGDVVDVLQVFLLDELLYGLREEFWVSDLHFFEGKERSGLVLQGSNGADDLFIVWICPCCDQLILPCLVVAEVAKGEVNAV